jgi:hypothetical protein
MNLTKEILANGDSVFVKDFKDFQSLQKECVILNDTLYTFRKTGSNTIHLNIFNPYPYMIDLRHKELPLVFQIAFMKNGIMEFKKNLELPDNISHLNIGDTLSVDCKFTIEDLQTGGYKLAICSEAGILYTVFSSPLRDAIINE